MKKTQIRNSFLLLLTATIWGTAFVAQSVGMDYVEPFTFTFARSIIGGLVLIPCIWFLRKLKERENKAVSGATAGAEIKTGAAATAGRPLITKTEWIGGICCGEGRVYYRALRGYCPDYGTLFPKTRLFSDLDLRGAFRGWVVSALHDRGFIDTGIWGLSGADLRDFVFGAYHGD